MGRKKKFSTDELIGFIKQYLIEHQSLELLMPTKVADYCKNVLHISIVYQSFTRDPLVKKWIDDYNYVKAYDILEPLTGDSEAGQLMDELMALVNERGWLRGNDGPFDYNDGHW